MTSGMEYSWWYRHAELGERCTDQTRCAECKPNGECDRCNTLDGHAPEKKPEDAYREAKEQRTGRSPDSTKLAEAKAAFDQLMEREKLHGKKKPLFQFDNTKHKKKKSED